MSDSEHTGLRGAIDRAADAMGGLAGKGAAGMTTGGSKFVERAVNGNRYELQAAAIALKRSRSEAVRAFAQRMKADHTTAHHQMACTLQSIPDAPEPPAELDSRHGQMIDHLEKASDDDFDQRYLEQQDLAHQETAELLDTFATQGDDPRLVMFARGTVPTVKRHLEHVRRLRNG
ncbi:MAG: DUF4142 domain-containing protein [Oceanicaulis sp.]